MKIIKQPDTSWSCQHTCSQCEAVLELEKTDIRCNYYSGSQYQNDPPSYSYYAICAVCGCSFSISVDSIPKIVKLELQKKATNSSSFDR